MPESTVIANKSGKRFTIRTVKRGDGYGVDDRIIHDRDDPIVEFYDLDYAEKFGPRGQFVSRYSASTLAHHADGRGLDLDGGVPSWTFDASSLTPVLDLARTLHGRCTDVDCI